MSGTTVAGRQPQVRNTAVTWLNISAGRKIQQISRKCPS
jgi:hypothetical protein